VQGTSGVSLPSFVKWWTRQATSDGPQLHDLLNEICFPPSIKPIF